MVWITARSVSADFAKFAKLWMKPRCMTPSAGAARADVQIGEITQLHFGAGSLHGQCRCVRACEAYDLMTCAKQLGNQARLVCR